MVSPQTGLLFLQVCHRGSVLGPLFFLIYINDLVENVSSDAKLFADDTSLFTVVYDEGTPADQLNRDLKVISDWAYQWKMQFNPDKNKQAILVIFSQKRTKPVHPPTFLNESEVKIKGCYPLPFKVCFTRCSRPNVQAECEATS